MSNIQIKSKIKSKIVSQFIFCMTKGGAEAPPQTVEKAQLLLDFSDSLILYMIIYNTIIM